MTTQEYGPFTFEPPDGWRSRVLVSFVDESADPERAAELVAARELRPAGRDLLAHAVAKASESARAERNAEILGSEYLVAAGRPTVKVRMRSTDEDGTPTMHAVAWIDAGEGSVLVLACRAPDDDGLRALDAALASLAFEPK